MKFHIIRTGETLSQIAFAYNLDEEELKKENKHIRYWDKLIPGTKLKIPVIPEAVDQDISEMEPFLEDYYPKLNLSTEDIDQNYYEISPKEEIYAEESEEEEKQEQPKIQQTKAEQIITKKEEPKESDGKETILESRPVIVPYYPLYYQYPGYFYPQYIYPVYVYSRRRN